MPGGQMRERCSCGASIRTLSRKQVNFWRLHHRHDMGEDEPEPDGAESSHERYGDRLYEHYSEDEEGQDVPVIQAKIGFTIE